MCRCLGVGSGGGLSGSSVSLGWVCPLPAPASPTWLQQPSPTTGQAWAPQPRWRCLVGSLGKGGQTSHGRGWWGEWGVALQIYGWRRRKRRGRKCPRCHSRSSSAAYGETIKEQGKSERKKQWHWGAVMDWLQTPYPPSLLQGIDGKVRNEGMKLSWGTGRKGEGDVLIFFCLKKGSLL